MQLSTQTILALANALSQLSSHRKVVKDGDKETTIEAPYQFAAETRAKIARNLARCTAVVDAYQRTRQGLLIQVSGGKSEIAPPPIADKDKPDYPTRLEAYADQIETFNKVNQMFLDEVHEIDLAVLKEADLKLEANPIPFQILALMAPMLEGWRQDAAPTFRTPLPEMGTAGEHAAPLANGSAAA
jgi:hypothetical protein